MNRLSIRGWLLVLPTVLLGLLASIVALLVAQSFYGKGLLDSANQRLMQRQAIANAASSCGGITQRAIVWTMTRRVAERRLYTEAKEQCAKNLAELVEVVDISQREVVSEISRRSADLTLLLETVQAEYDDEAKMRTVSRLEREVKPITTHISKNLDQLVADGDTASQSALTDLAAQNTRAAQLGLAAGVLGLLLGIVITMIVLRRLVGALGRARDATQTLAAGDLRQPIVSRHQDEIGAMLASLEAARLAWIRAIGDIQTASGRIRLISIEIQQGARMINGNAAEASERLGQTSDAVGDLLRLVDQSTEDALAASKLAEQATAVASSGGQVVRDVASTMTSIQQSSIRISDINAVIDSIAFQTNILALNAAVEAARAGEVQLALTTLRRMEEHGPAPNETSYNLRPPRDRASDGL
jgi:methyl-accepting chemotaxis protein